MDNIKNLNLKKQLLSLKFCYEDQLLQTKALISKVHNLENIFKLTKQIIKEKKDKNFDFKNEKRYLLISNQKKNLSHNIGKQSKTLLKSILYNNYQELQRKKESFLQEIEEKTNILNSLKNELKLYKLSHPYGTQVTKIYLNDTLDSLLTINDNKKLNVTNNNEVDIIIKKKFNNIIFNEKKKLLKKCEETCYQMKKLYNHSFYIYQKMIKENGFNSYISNKKYNKTYIFTIEPIKDEYNNSSNDSDSENNDNINDIQNSINDHIFDEETTKKRNIIYKNYFPTNKKSENNINNKNKFIHELSCLRNETSENYHRNNRDISIKNIFNHNSNFELNKMNITGSYIKGNNGFITEINNSRNGELNKKLLKTKEYYYKCLDERYELKNALKLNISQIYNIKEKIKKIKKENNNKDNLKKNN